MLKVSGEFATVEEHSNYLQCVYETLLAINEIAVESLQQCAAEAVAAEQGDASEGSGTISETRSLRTEQQSDRFTHEVTAARNKIAYGQHKHHSQSRHDISNSNSSSSSNHRRKLAEPSFADILVEPTPAVDCEHDVAYNLVMTSSYMMVVPRSAKAFNDVVTMNSFGYIGFMMASSKQKLEVIK